MYVEQQQLSYILNKVITAMSKRKDSDPFQAPVDPVELNIPVSFLVLFLNILFQNIFTRRLLFSALVVKYEIFQSKVRVQNAIFFKSHFS